MHGIYESFFGLSERPFAAAPRVDRYFPAAAIEASRDTLSRTIERAEGVSLLIGPAGCGKTLLLNVLAQQYAERFTVVAIGGLKLTSRRALLQAILFEAGLPYRRMEEGELRLALLDHLRPADKCPDGMLILFDECHTLQPKLLEELRLLTNVVRDGAPRVRLVLCGGSVMEERFAQPRMQAFQQRITARCYLEPFSRSETLGYVQSQLAAVGGEWSSILTEDALSAVHQASDGVPRVINQLCDHALLMASAGGVRPIEATGIEEAWADLQQLPLPWNAPPEDAAEGANAIEFGSLDDEDDDSAWQEDEAAINLPIGHAEQQGVRPPHGEWPTGNAEDEPPLDESDDLATTDIEEPFEQLDRIERHLADVEEDFYPPGEHEPEIIIEAGPTEHVEIEVDLSKSQPTAPAMTAAVDPFADDEFDDEEVVINPNAQIDEKLLTPRRAAATQQPKPDVAVAEEPEIELEDSEATPGTVPFSPAKEASHAEAQPEVTKLEPAKPTGRILYDDVVLPEIDFSSEEPAACEPFVPEDDPVLPEDRFERQAVAPVEDEHCDVELAEPEEDGEESETLPLHSFVQARSDSDLIVVEENNWDEDTDDLYHDYVQAEHHEPTTAEREATASNCEVETANELEVPAREQSTATTRQQEYRNLFSRLRRGE